MNNKWYQSAPCKGILIVLEHILAVVMITCLVFTFSYPGDNLAGILFEKPHKKYEQSKGFTDKLMSAANDITAAEGYDSNFETEGKYDENRIVDLKEYDSDRKISNENVNGLAYRLGDLVNYWENDQEMYYADGTKMADGDNDDEIIVCQKDDGTYHYYYEKEFRREFKNGNLQFGNMDEAKDEYSLESTGEVIDSLINDWIESSASIYRNILDSENRQVYTKCWRYDGEKVSENCAPVGAKNLLEVVNKDSRWNGKLSDAMSMLGNTVDSVRDNFLTWQYVTEEYKEGNTNLAYMIVDLDNKKVYTNRLAYQRFDEWEKNLESMKKLGVYAVATPKLTEYQSDIDMDGSQWKSLIGGNMWMDNYECVFAVDTSYPIQDDFYQESKIYQEYAPQVRFTFWIAIATVFAMLVILAWLTIVAGRSNREEGIVLNRVDKMKTELFILLSVAVMVICIYGEISLSYSLLNGVWFSGSGLIYGYVNDGFYTVADFESFDSKSRTWKLKEGVVDSSPLSDTPRPGNAKFKKLTPVDPNSSNPYQLTEADRTVIGNTTPKFSGGFGLNATYKGFDLSMFFNFMYDFDVFNANKVMLTTWADNHENNFGMEVASDKRWRNFDDMGNEIRYSPELLAEFNKNATMWNPTSIGKPISMSYAVEDGSFLRLNSATLGYTLPQEWTKKAGLNKVRFYVAGSNLFTITGYSGYDPEVDIATGLTPNIDNNRYPRSRTYTFGAQLTF